MGQHDDVDLRRWPSGLNQNRSGIFENLCASDVVALPRIASLQLLRGSYVLPLGTNANQEIRWRYELFPAGLYKSQSRDERICDDIILAGEPAKDGQRGRLLGDTSVHQTIQLAYPVSTAGMARSRLTSRNDLYKLNLRVLCVSVVYIVPARIASPCSTSPRRYLRALRDLYWR